MPVLSEFTLTLCQRRNEESGAIVTIFRFATLKEFRSFRYEIQVAETFDSAAHVMEFRISGVQAPTNLMPGAGAAVKEIGYPELRGEYAVTCHGARQSESFRFVVDDSGIRLTEPPPEDSLRVSVEKGIENMRV